MRLRIEKDKKYSTMKNLRLLLLTISVFIYSCIDYEIYQNPVNIILQNYGGEIEYGPGMGIGAGSKGNKYDYLSVELSNSLFLQYGISPDLLMTHIATEFAKVTPDNISEIQVELSDIPFNNEVKNFSKTISIDEAKLIIQKEKILHNCFDKIALNNISEFTSTLTEEFEIAFSEQDGELVIKEINKMIGEYKGSIFRGYDILVNNSVPEKELILLNGLMLGSVQNAVISIIIDPQKSSDRCILEMKY